MAEKKNVSPEEKLLNVIQGKEKPASPGADAAKAAAEPKPQAPATPPSPAAGPVGGAAKPALSLQPPPRPAPVRPAEPGAVPAPVPPAAKPADDAPRVAPKPAPKAAPAPTRPNLKAPSANRLDVRSRTLATVNRLLRIGVVAMLGLCVWQIWANSSAASAPEKIGAGRKPRPAVAQVAPSEPCSALLPSFGGKSLFVPLVPEVVEPTVTNIEKKTTISEAQQYVTRNLNLIGVSPGRDGTIQEAILTDTQTKRNYFLKVGDKITLKNWAIELKKIATDHAVFLCGKEEIQVQ